MLQVNRELAQARMTGFGQGAGSTRETRRGLTVPCSPEESLEFVQFGLTAKYQLTAAERWSVRLRGFVRGPAGTKSVPLPAATVAAATTGVRRARVPGA
jgi:hypothetical protein